MFEEYSVYGVFVPTLLIMAMFAYLLLQVMDWGLTHLDAYRFVWHPPLFNLALYFLILGALFYLHRVI